MEGMARVGGHVDAELLLRNEYVVIENEILKEREKGLLRFTDKELRRLAELGNRLGHRALADVALVRANVDF